MLRYFILINTITLLLMGYDKRQAIHKKERTPEIALITLSFIGGGMGSLLGMLLFHHKTKKIKFLILIPLSIITTLIFLIYK